MVWIALAVLLIARASLILVPTTWAWSVNLMRFLHPVAAWLPWSVAALMLIPPVARIVTPACARLGDLAGRRPAVATLAWSIPAALAAWLMPDRVRYVGDFLLRQHTLEDPWASSTAWYPQALPLDLFLHDTLGRWFMQATGASANTHGRILGALEAGLFAACAVAFARTLRLRGTPSFAATAIVLFGGYLTMFTGYNKAFSEMCVVVAAFTVALLAVARDGSGLLALGTALAVGLLVHRSMLACLPAWIVGVVGWLRHHERTSWKRPGVVVALLLPLGVLGAMAPKLYRVLTRIDPMHVASSEVRRLGVLGAAFAPVRAADVGNLIVMMSPLFVVAPVLAVLSWRWIRSRSEAPGLGTLAACFFTSVLFVHPGQGIFRDWDAFAAAGVALSLATAWIVGATLEGAPGRAWLGVAVAASCAVPALQWMAHDSDLDRGLQRVHTFVEQPPERLLGQRSSTWEYLGLRNSGAERWEASAIAYRRAAALVSSPNILRQLAAAESEAGHFERARAVYRQMLDRDPDDALAWLGLGVASFRLGDYPATRSAARQVLKRDARNEEARRVLEYLDRRAAGGDSLAAAGR